MKCSSFLSIHYERYDTVIKLPSKHYSPPSMASRQNWLYKPITLLLTTYYYYTFQMSINMHLHIYVSRHPPPHLSFDFGSMIECYGYISYTNTPTLGRNGKRIAYFTRKSCLKIVKFWVNLSRFFESKLLDTSPISLSKHNERRWCWSDGCNIRKKQMWISKISTSSINWNI